MLSILFRILYGVQCQFNRMVDLVKSYTLISKGAFPFSYAFECLYNIYEPFCGSLIVDVNTSFSLRVMVRVPHPNPRTCTIVPPVERLQTPGGCRHRTASGTPADTWRMPPSYRQWNACRHLADAAIVPPVERLQTPGGCRHRTASGTPADTWRMPPSYRQWNACRHLADAAIVPPVERLQTPGGCRHRTASGTPVDSWRLPPSYRQWNAGRQLALPPVGRRWATGGMLCW